MRTIATLIAVALTLGMSAVDQNRMRLRQKGASGGAACTVTSDGSASDTQTKLTAATAGQTVCLPAGTFHWSTQVSWTAPANARLIGAGSLTTTGGGDSTILVDDYASNNAILDVTANATGTFRVAGITFKGGTGSVKDGGGFLYIRGTSTQARVDHNHFDKRTYSPQNNGKISVVGVTAGLFDHNIIHYGTGIGWNHIVNGTSEGDVEWAAATGFGTANFWVMEDNELHSDESADHRWYSVLTDCHTGGRFVARYNTFDMTAIGQTHPTGHAGHDRGCRAHETYGNTVTLSATWDGATDEPMFSMDYSNSGASVVWGNAADLVFKSFLYFNVIRQDNGTYPQAATPNGWGYCGTQFNGTGSNWDGGTIGGTNTLYGYPCLDQPGRGQGDLLSGDFPAEINNTTSGIAWPHQALEPVYEWLNTGNFVTGWGGSAYVNNTAGTDRMAQNRDYYLYRGNTSCDPGAGSCTAGVGSGTRAQRPSNCTAGVAWWATDQGGNWNTTNGGANDGTLDVCTATNTWTNASYTPYTYPHPLNQ